MPIIQRPDLVEKVRRQYEITGPDPINTISPEIVPVTIIENLAEEDLNRIRCIGGYTATAAGGQYPHTNLYLPNVAANSNIQCHLTAVTLACSNNSSTFELRTSNGNLGTAGLYLVSDTRLRPRTSPASRVSYASQAVPTGVVYADTFAPTGNMPFTIPLDLWIVAGYGYGFTVNTAASRLHVWFHWDEYLV